MRGMSLERAALDPVYREFDAKIADLAYKFSATRKYEGEVITPSVEARDYEKARWENLLAEARGLAAPDPVLELLKGHFEDFLSARLSGVETAYAHPARFLGAQTRFIDHLARQDSRPAPERFRLFKTRFSQIDGVWKGTRSFLTKITADKQREVVSACRVLGKVASKLATRVSEYYPGLSEHDAQDLEAMLRRLSAKAIGWEAEASRAGTATERCPVGEGHAPGAAAGQAGRESGGAMEAYERILRDELGVELDELLKWYESEIELTRHEMLEAAARVEAGVRTPAEVSELLYRLAGPADTVEEMFSRMERYVAAAREASMQGYVDLPEEKCLVKPTPEQARDDYPWGGYGGGCWRRRPLIGECFLNETNYRAVTDGWLKMMAIHECYPGHHAQFVRSIVDPLPSTVAMGAKSIPLTEGTAHRSERLLEGIFPDPAFPVFVRLRRHHTAVRIKADLYLHYCGRPVEDAVQLYVDELGFDWNTARSQVRYQERNPGYMTCYYYGMKRLQDFQAEYMPDEKEFTRTLFSVGRISLSSLERFLKLAPEDRLRFQTGFKSLLQEE